MNNKYLLSKNDLQIRIDTGAVKDELTLMNRWLSWFNGLSYVTPINDLDTAKAFLSNTQGYHNNQVETFLKAKPGGDAPNQKPLREAWEIQDCEQKDFSKCASWPDLQFTNGVLTVSDSVFTAIEERHCIKANTKAEKALVDRIEKFARELEYFAPKQYASQYANKILIDCELFTLDSKGRTLNLNTYYKLLNK